MPRLSLGGMIMNPDRFRYKAGLELQRILSFRVL
jgi:hypothetical protein